MGKPAQKRLIRKLDVELLLSRIRPHPSPQTSLEQYTVSEAVAAKMLHFAAYIHDDILGKTILDLGCGTGRLALAAAFLGAQTVVGVDIDKVAIKAASENSEKTGLRDKTHWVAGDITTVNSNFDTVLQNPPFGVQRRTADRRFLERALEVSRTIYSLHKHPCVDRQLIKILRANAGSLLQVSPSLFIKKFVEEHNGKIEAVYAMLMTIPHMFDFHKKARHDFVVDLYLIRRKD